MNLSFLSDGEKFSINRLQAALTLFSILIVWVITSIKTGAMIDIPDGVYTLVGISLTAQTAGKVSEVVRTIKSNT